MKMKKLMGLIIVLTVFVGVVGCSNLDGQAQATNSGGKEIINLGVTPYPHMDLITNILELSFEELGYATQRVEGDVGFMYLGMSQGDIDIYADGWLPVLHGNYIDKYNDKLEVGNTIYEEATMGIVVPAYVEIDTIQGFKDHADLFDNKLIGIEPSAGIMLTATETMEAYEMDNIEMLEGSTPAMLSEVAVAIKEERPIAFLGWRPHIMFSEYDLKVLKDDKGIWEYDDIRSVMDVNFKEKAPIAYEYMQQFQISIDEIEEILFKSDSGEGTIEELARQWLESNRDLLDEMIGQGVASE